MVEVGQIIIANNERYEVDAIWPVGASKVIDFTAKQLTGCGRDIEGNPVYAGRGFSYAVKNWELESKTMKLKQIDTSKVVTYREMLLDYGVYDYEIVANMTEGQCKDRCDDINGALTEKHLLGKAVSGLEHIHTDSVYGLTQSGMKIKFSDGTSLTVNIEYDEELNDHPTLDWIIDLPNPVAAVKDSMYDAAWKDQEDKYIKTEDKSCQS